MCSWAHSCIFREHVAIEATVCTASCLCKHQKLPALLMTWHTNKCLYTQMYSLYVLIKSASLFLMLVHRHMYAINKHTHAVPPSLPESPVLACLHHQTLECAPSVSSLLTTHHRAYAYTQAHTQHNISKKKCLKTHIHAHLMFQP